MAAAKRAEIVMEPVRILLVDDHPIVRDGIRLVVEQLANARVIAEADNGRDAVELAARHQPDLAIVDIGLKEMDGIETTARIKERSASTRVLILSGHSSAKYVIRSLQAGADGYLVKDSTPADLKLAVAAVMAGETYLSPAISKHVVAGLRGGGAAREGSDALSGRQCEILRMMAEGQSTKEIAFVLQVSTKTVETHRARIMERLDIHDLAGLVVYAIKHGVSDIDSRSA
jgi:DNA-binding NarL/FixJ family response regulator